MPGAGRYTRSVPLAPEDARTDGPAVLFMALDGLLRDKEPQLLSLGARLNEIQLLLRTSSPPEVHDEIMGILRTLTELVQGLTWYGSDLDDVASTIEQLPGMRGGVTGRFSHHCERVSRMRESAGDYRQQAKDAFDHYSSNAANRQGQLINILTVVATLFLPLTFLTGFFGMDFGVLVKNLNSPWAFVLLGLLLPAATVAMTLLLYSRLLRRLGVGNSPTHDHIPGQPPPGGWGTMLAGSQLAHTTRQGRDRWQGRTRPLRCWALAPRAWDGS
jgi:hypothetical protein